MTGGIFGQPAGHDRAEVLNDAAVRLPPRRSSFVGRTWELAEVAARLESCAVVTLVGVGGVGKTALAVEAAWIEVSAGRAPLAFFADLAPCRNDEQVLAAIVECAGIRGTQAAAGLDAVVDMVSGREALLVVDNCEHVLAAAPSQLRSARRAGLWPATAGDEPYPAGRRG